MFKNYLKISLRNLRKYPAFSFINISGLAIGMTCFILILLYVRDELSYDKYHENAGRIYRITREWFNSDGTSSLHLGHVAPPIGPLLRNDFPEFTEVVRLWQDNPLLNYRDKFFLEEDFFFVEENIFNVFSFPLLKGDKETALSKPGNILVTEETAKKYFGDEDPVGKIINYNNIADFKVTGVLKNVPVNSHFHFDFFASFVTLEEHFKKTNSRELQRWGSNNYPTYVLLPKNVNLEDIKRKIPGFLNKHYNPNASKGTTLHFQKMTDIHLHSHLDSEIEQNSDIKNVYIFGSIAFFILLIACINFMNLSTARSANRCREVGMRKVAGAYRSQLIKQFLGESILISIFALTASIILVLLILPSFNNFIQKDIRFGIFDSISLTGVLIITTVFVGIISGSYPAFFLSGFKPAGVLKGISKTSGKASVFRTILVILQFVISISLIISMGIINDQINFIRNKNLGLDKKNVIYMYPNSRIRNNFESFRTQLLENPNIIHVSGSKRVPSGKLLDSWGARTVSGDKDEQVNFRIAAVPVDYDYFPTYGIEMAAGRNFSKEFPTDSTKAIILNETAVKKLGWGNPENAIGKPFIYGDRKVQIVGVVKDFHFESLHNEITPIAFLIYPGLFNRISVKLNPVNTAGTIDFIRQKWNRFSPNYPFDYTFIEDRYEQRYQSEKKLSDILAYFSVLAVFIACLGLTGLASFTAEQKTKEIGIRKVLGASTGNIVILLIRKFSVWAIAANIFAWPVSFYIMSRWLQNFAYRTDITIYTFLFSSLIALVITILTVSYQSIKAAAANPVNCLKYE